MNDPDITPELLQTIDILESLENLYDNAPTDEIARILINAWLQITQTFPEDFQEATQDDAGAEGLRRYIRVKAFFSNPSENPISHEDLAQYYENRQEIDWEEEE
jgi:hypothetical protein